MVYYYSFHFLLMQRVVILDFEVRVTEEVLALS